MKVPLRYTNIFLCTYYVPDTVIGAWDILVKKTKPSWTSF